MIEDREVHRLSIEIPVKEALRYLGMARQKREPREAVRRMIDEELRLAETLIEPRAVLARSPAGLPGSAFIAPDAPIAIGVCSIGPALDRRVSELFAEGDGARGVVLDAIGSAAAEEVADCLDAMICARAASEGTHPEIRRSPGYGRWDVREQRLIFDFLRPVESGVELNESCMMVPQKSISFVVPLTGGEGRQGKRVVCMHCGMLECEYRHPSARGERRE